MERWIKAYEVAKTVPLWDSLSHLILYEISKSPEPPWAQEEIGKSIGKSQQTVSEVTRNVDANIIGTSFTFEKCVRNYRKYRKRYFRY